jgi:hypothetical protein
MGLLLSVSPAQAALEPRPEPQLCYALVTLAADAGGGAEPVNWAVVADASRSMRIPIVSEDQFRELVRSGGAQEVLVDGVPVWQLAGPVPEAVRAAAPSALDHIARALSSVIERLDRADRLSVIACAEQARVLAAAGGDRRDTLAAGAARLRAAALGEETDLAAGMALALDELRAGSGVSRLILLTDGFTRDPEACLALARRAAAAAISVSTLGLGGEFQDHLLTQLADLTGGRAVFLRRAEQVPAAVAAELDAARGVAARALTLELALPRGATLRYATRLSPALAPLEWEASEDGRRALLRLGDLERGHPARLLLEILAPPAPPRPGPDGALVRVAALAAASGAARASADLIARYGPAPQPPPPLVLDAAARAAAARFQRRAAEAAARGDAAAAAALHRAAAARLDDLGERELAAAARREAAALAATGVGTGLDARELTYATRRLGEHEAG